MTNAMLTKAKSTKWGVAAIFAAGAGLVLAECIDFNDPVVQQVADIVGTAVGGGIVLLGRKLFAKFGTPKPTETPPTTPTP